MLKIKYPLLNTLKLPHYTSYAFNCLLLLSLFFIIVPNHIKKDISIIVAPILIILFLFKRPYSFFYFLVAGMILGGDKFAKISLSIGALPVYITELFIIFSLVILIANYLLSQHPRKIILPSNWQIFIIWWLISLYAFGYGLSRYDDKIFVLREFAFAYYSIFYFIIVQIISDKNKLLKLLNISLLCGIAIALNLLTNKPIKLLGSFEYLYCGMILVYLFSVLDVPGLISDLKKKTVYNILVVIFISVFILSEARAAWIGMLLYFIWILFLNYDKKISLLLISKIFSTILLFALIASSLAILLFPKKVISIYTEISSLMPTLYNSSNSSLILSNNNTKWRLYVWQDILKESFEKPIMGWGYGKKFIPKTIQTLGWGGSWHDSGKGFQAPHNSLLTIFHNTGLIGLTTFICIVFLYIKHIYHHLPSINDFLLRKIYIASSGATIYILVSSFFMVILEGPYMGIFFWLNMGISSAVEIINSSTNQQLSY